MTRETLIARLRESGHKSYDLAPIPEELQKEMLAALRAGWSCKSIAKEAGIARSTVRKYRDRFVKEGRLEWNPPTK